MALVAYDCSDHSDNDNSDDDEPVNIAKTPKSVEGGSNFCEGAPLPTSANLELPTCSGLVRNDARQNGNNHDDSDSSSTDDDQPIDVSFSTLPKPQYNTLYVDESKLKTAKSKIWKKLVSLPRVDRTTIAKRQGDSTSATSKKSVLLSLLPTPSCESTKTVTSTISNTKLVPTVLGNKPKPKQTATKIENDEENSDSDTDFFSLSKIDKEPEYDASSVDLSIFDEINAPKKSNVVSEDTTRVSELNKYLREDDLTKQGTVSVDDYDTHSYLVPQSQLHLDEDAVLKLCGRKRKGQVPDDIQVIDIHEDNVLAETRKNLTKRLTEEISYRPARSGGTSTLSKRKHQITYLAFQAKERELELKNQWAQNRFNKKQTQSKYGF